MPSSTTFLDKSSFTAGLVAYFKTFSDIPYAREIFNVLQEIQPVAEDDLAYAKTIYDRAPMFEARDIMTEEKITRSGAKVVVEFGAGLSPCGLSRTLDPDMLVIEVDLPEELALKRNIVSVLIGRSIIAPRPNLRFLEGNVCDPRIFADIADMLPGGPIAVACRGVLRYLDMADKSSFMSNARWLLELFGGIFVTPDAETQDEEEKLPGFRERHEHLANRTKIDALPNIFKDRATMMKFFDEQHRFDVDATPLSEVAGRLVSPARLGLPPGSFEAALAVRSTLVMVTR